MVEKVQGYIHRGYANAFSELGEPRDLPSCGGCVLIRNIPDSPDKDAMGCYPLFACQNWSHLHEDLKEVGEHLVSLALVTDPFATVDLSYLERHFQIVTPFKSHYIVDLTSEAKLFVHKKHRRHALKSLTMITVEICEEPFRYFAEWNQLYENLIYKHQISGIRSFSRDSFRQQLQVPGTVIAIAKLGEEVVGGLIVMIQGDVAYAHLAASSDVGYKCNSAFGVFWTVIGYLKEHGVRLFDVGGTHGTQENSNDGLTRFKSGWSNGTRMAYFCGKIFNKKKYNDICLQKRIIAPDYFPAYRVGEFR